MRRPLLYLHIALNFFMCCTPGMSAPPAWWTAGNPPVIDPAATPNSRGPANIGQAKWMAKNALEALRAVSPATAEAVESELVSDPEADPPENKPIKTWAAPTTPEEHAAQRAPLLIGQLKAISAPFYNHLNALNPTWLQNELTLNQTAVSGSHFPWTVETTDDANKAVATIGQLKAVFSLRFETLPVANDTDGDGMPDEWELAYGLNPNDPADAALDLDGDLLTCLEEFKLGTSPTGVFKIVSTPLLTTVTGSGGTSNVLEEFHRAGPDGTVVTRQTDTTSGYYYKLKEGTTGFVRTGPFTVAGGTTTSAVRVADNGSLNGEVIGATASASSLRPDLGGTGTPLAWSTISTSLSGSGYSTPGNGAAIAVSSSGAVRLYEDPINGHFLTNQSGQLSDLPIPPRSDAGSPGTEDDVADISWQFVNDQGEAVSIHTFTDPQTQEPKTEILWGTNYGVTRLPVPETWWTGGNLPQIKGLSNDGVVLIQHETLGPDNAVHTVATLVDFDAEEGEDIFIPIQQPGLVGETVAALSRTGKRTVGAGPTPWINLLGGKPLPLSLAQIRIQMSGPSTAFSAEDLSEIVLHDITPDGRITFTAKNDAQQSTILQLVPNNDADADGIADDWEKWWAAKLLATGGAFTPSQQTELESGDLSPTADYTDDGLTVADFNKLDAADRKNDAAGEAAIAYGDVYHLVRIRTMHLLLTRSTTDLMGSGTYWVESEGEPKVDDFGNSFSVSAPTLLMDKAPWDNLAQNLYPRGVVRGIADAYDPQKVANFLNSRPNSLGNTTEAYGYYARERKFQVRLREPAEQTRYFAYVKVTRSMDRFQEGTGTSTLFPTDYRPELLLDPTLPVTINHELVMLSIPAGKFTSSEYQVTPAFTEGRVTEISFMPLDVVDKDKISISKLKVAKMDENNVLTRTGNSTVLDIDKDSDRFYVRLAGGSALGNISVKVSTIDNPDSTYNDNATQIDLVVDGSDAISKSMLLVSDSVDDEHPVDGVADDASGDRTHKIQLGGSFNIDEIKIGTGAWQDVDMDVPAPFEKTVKVKFVNCTYGLSGGFCWEPGDITLFKKILKERYAQAGIELKFSQWIGTGIWIDLDGWLEADEYSAEVVAGVQKVPQKTKDIINQGPPINRDEVAIYLVRRLNNSAQTNFYSGIAIPARYSPSTLYANKILMGLYHDHFAGAHELLHVLADAKHDDFPYEFADSTMIWSYPVSDVDKIDATKRISRQQVDRILMNPLAK